MQKKEIIILLGILVLIIVLIGIVILSNKSPKVTNTSTAKTENAIKNENIVEEQESEEKSMYSSGVHHATIEIKDYGTIKLELDADTAPITVANFAKLVNEGFYNGLTFHRIISGFMIQGGDPQGNGFGGSSQTIKGEFSKNGVENNISHVRGVISMARSSNPNSASSQFFIMHKDAKYLDGQYAAFGKVLEGMEVVDKICETVQVEDANGTVAKENQPVIDKIIMDD